MIIFWSFRSDRSELEGVNLEDICLLPILDNLVTSIILPS